ncbi:MAG TPA: energy transducer TonB [Terracidiphilus sp.]|nr:energy transducer TonB [Terracidiphilus sp.]
MFEDSTFESTGRIRTRSRGWMAATFTINSAVLVALALFPLLYPEALPRVANIFLMTIPPPQQEPPQPPPQRQPMPRVVQVSEIVGQRLIAPPVIPRDPYVPNAPEPLQLNTAANWGDSQSAGPGMGVFGKRGGEPSVRPAPQTKARESQGVMDGYLVNRFVPEYPPIAREARIEGTVVLQATISKAGTIENLHVVSGPEMLQRAAIDAVSQWRYRPYLLNGDPVEVETTVNVQFTLH